MSRAVPAGAAGALPEAAHDAMAEAAAFRFLAVALERPRAGWLEELEALGRSAADPAFAEVARQAGPASEGQYHSLLGPGGAVPAREAAYCGLRDPARVLAELAAAHEAFGYERTTVSDPVDHLAVVVDFAAYLWMKEAYALAAGRAQDAETTAVFRRRFMEDHLGPFARGFAERLGDGGPAHLVLAARALAGRVPAIGAVGAVETAGPDLDDPGQCG